MKLHLPKLLRNALLATFVVCVSTTIGADTISINFGKTEHNIPTTATGEVGGVAAAAWNNITGDNRAAVNGTHTLTSQKGVAYTNVLTLNTGNDPWGPGGNDSTVLSAMQRGYLDLGAGTTWNIQLNVDYISTDYTLYFNGDGNGQYTAIRLNGTSYIGGEGSDNDEAGKTNHWGVRQTVSTVDDNNTISLEDIGGVTDITNIAVNDTNYRATMSGMQVKLNDINEHTLAAGTTRASTLDSSTGYLGLSADANGSTLDITGSDLKGVQASAGVLTLTGAGSVDRLWAKKDATLKIQNVESDSAMELGGLGKIVLESGKASFSNAHVYAGDFEAVSGSTINIAADLSAEQVTGGVSYLEKIVTLTGAGVTTTMGSYKLHSEAASGTHVLYGNLVVDGWLELNGSNERTWEIATGASLSATGELRFKRKQTLKISGGSVTAQKLILGHEEPGDYPGYFLMESGNMEVDGIYLRYGGGNDKVTVKGGTITFTPDSATDSVITRDNNNSSVEITNATLKVVDKSWTLNLGTEGKDVILGGVTMDIASGQSATLGGDITLTNAFVHNSAGTLKLAEGTVLNLIDSESYLEKNTTLTDLDGSVSVTGNGFQGGEYIIIKGTGAVEGSAQVNYLNKTVTIDSDHRTLQFDTDYTMYFLGEGEVVYSDVAKVAGENGVTEAVVIRTSADTELEIGAETTDSAAAGAALVAAQGSGDILLTTDAVVANRAVSSATGKLTISGATLSKSYSGNTHNTDKTLNFDLSSFDSVVLDDATIEYVGSDTTFRNVTVTENGASIILKDTNADGHAVYLSGTTLLEGDLTVAAPASGESWKYNLNIAALTGTGNINFKSSQNSGCTNKLIINSAQHSNGIITVEKWNARAQLVLNAQNNDSIGGLTLLNGAEAIVSVHGNKQASLGAVSLTNGSTIKTQTIESGKNIYSVVMNFPAGGSLAFLL